MNKIIRITHKKQLNVYDVKPIDTDAIIKSKITLFMGWWVLTLNHDPHGRVPSYYLILILIYLCLKWLFISDAFHSRLQSSEFRVLHGPWPDWIFFK